MKTKLTKILIIISLLSLLSCNMTREQKAAAIIGGLGLVAAGYALSSHINNRTDQANMQDFLTNAPVNRPMSWTNPSSGITYTMVVTNNYNGNNILCRQFQTVGIINGQRETLVGNACRRSDGYWVIRPQ